MKAFLPAREATSSTPDEDRPEADPSSLHQRRPHRADGAGDGSAAAAGLTGILVAVEPGICPAGDFGVRVEDLVAVTTDGGRRLNNTSHELRTVG